MATAAVDESPSIVGFVVALIYSEIVPTETIVTATHNPDPAALVTDPMVDLLAQVAHLVKQQRAVSCPADQLRRPLHL